MFSRAVTPGQGLGWPPLGLVFRDQRRLDEAAEAFRRAVALRPDMAHAHNNLGVGLRDLGQVDAAMEHFRRAIALSANLFHARTNLGLTLLDRSDHEPGRVNRAAQGAHGYNNKKIS